VLNREAVASGNERLRQVLYPGDVDQSIAQLRWITLLRAVIRRPYLLDLALGGVILDGIGAPLHVPRIDETGVESESSIVTLTEPGTFNASTPESILPMTMIPGSGISWPSCR
jgi:hypothetical protein